MKNKIFILYLLLSAVFAYDRITGYPLPVVQKLAENGMAATPPSCNSNSYSSFERWWKCIDAAIAANAVPIS